jgi:biopolymer transport protein ExbB
MSLLLQVKVAGSSEAAATVQQDISVLELVMKGGIIMIPIAILSVLAIYIIIERLLYISKAGKINPQNMMMLKDKLRSGNVKEAAMFCKSTNSAWGRIFANGTSLVGQPMKDIQDRVEDSAQIEMAKMERNMTYLNLIAGVAPLLGFIGTISGVIKIFHKISITADISIGNISEGLYEKMITSASGLVVGIIAFAGYHMLNTRIDRFASKIQENALSFKSTLQGVEE